MEIRLICCGALAFCVTACCFGRRRCCSAARSGSNSRCRSACCVLPASGGRTEWSSWTIGNSIAMPSRSWRTRSASCATPCPSPGGSSRTASSGSTSPYTRLWPHARRLANALCHRDYSIGGGSVGIAVYDDRLEVTSSGSLHFGLTPEKLFAPHESRPWNPLIARTFYRRGIIEEWGSGTLKMAELSSSSGLPVPEIEDDGGAVTVRFRHGQFVPQPEGTDASPARRRAMILALLDSAADGLARRDMSARLAPHASERQVTRDLEALKERGLIASSGHGASARWKRVRNDR